MALLPSYGDTADLQEEALVDEDRFDRLEKLIIKRNKGRRGAERSGVRRNREVLKCFEAVLTVLCERFCLRIGKPGFWLHMSRLVRIHGASPQSGDETVRHNGNWWIAVKDLKNRGPSMVLVLRGDERISPLPTALSRDLPNNYMMLSGCTVASAWKFPGCDTDDGSSHHTVPLPQV